MTVDVRPARDEDVPALAVLLDQLGYPSDRHEVARRLAAMQDSAADHVLVAVEDGAVAGFVSLTIAPLFAGDGSLARLTALAVRDGRRRGGLGAALVAAAEALAARAGCGAVQVSSGKRPERAAAHRFYPALGYHDADEHHTLYEKRLAP